MLDNNLESEIWEYTHDNLYEISNMGRIRRAVSDRGRKLCLLRPALDQDGYLRVSLSSCNRRVSRRIHRLVAEAFIGTRPIGYVVNHKDGDKVNNAAPNLEYMTPQENDRHASVNGLKASGMRNGNHTCPHARPRGSRHGKSKLCERSVRVIINGAFSGRTRRELAITFGVHPDTIRDILLKRTWTHVIP